MSTETKNQRIVRNLSQIMNYISANATDMRNVREWMETLADLHEERFEDEGIQEPTAVAA
jgi:hypothetical protein